MPGPIWVAKPTDGTWRKATAGWRYNPPQYNCKVYSQRKLQSNDYH